MLKLLGFVIIVVYIGGVWKFWQGFHRTNFSKALPNRIMLSLLWPVLLASNKPYRKNFNKALKGQ